jgi:hypothetical protein
MSLVYYQNSCAVKSGQNLVMAIIAEHLSCKLPSCDVRSAEGKWRRKTHFRCAAAVLKCILDVQSRSIASSVAEL